MTMARYLKYLPRYLVLEVGNQPTTSKHEGGCVEDGKGQLVLAILFDASQVPDDALTAIVVLHRVLY